MRAKGISIVLMMIIIILAGCSQAQETADMPNPASVFCEENDGKVEIRTDKNGAQAGFCMFDDGSECDEWAFFRGECSKEDSSAEPGLEIANPASEFCVANQGKVEIITLADRSQTGRCVFSDGSSCEEWAFFNGKCAIGIDFGGIVLAEDDCRLFQNPALGYEVHFPIDAILTKESDLAESVTIQGPMVDGEAWPMIFINHPQGRADFKPSADIDLEEWLVQQNLLVEEPVDERIIAGELAIHTRHARSDQSFASDSYWFAHNGQLYNIVIQHTGEKEDWDLYNHILDSLNFEAGNIYP